MKRRLTKLTAAGLAVLALTGCTGGVPEEVSEEPPVPKNVETTWTLVVGQPEGSTCWDAAESFAEALSDATEGAVAVEVQPRPLDRVTSLEQAAAGIVDLYLDSSFIYGSYGDEEELGRPFFSVTMPFLFPDAETAAEVLDSTGGEALNGVLAELGLRGLAYGELGFRYPTTSEGRAVTAPEDLEGLKIRTAGMLEVSLAYVDCWGAELYPSSFLDVMTPLSAGYYDGQESTLAEADAAGYQTVQTDVTIFPAFYEPAILTMNSDLYDSLSPDLREAVDRCGREAMAGPAAPEPGAGGGDPGAVAGRGRHLRPCFDRGAVGGLPDPDGTALRPGGPGPSGLVCGLYAGVGGAVSPLLKKSPEK